MSEESIKKQRSCEFCNKSINKRFVKITNIEQDIPTHYFCTIKCKFRWLDKEKKKEEKPEWKTEWYPIEQEYIDETGELPYQEDDDDLSKDFKNWLTKRNERIMKEEMEKGIQEVIKEEEMIKKTGNLRDWL